MNGLHRSFVALKTDVPIENIVIPHTLMTLNHVYLKGVAMKNQHDSCVKIVCQR